MALIRDNKVYRNLQEQVYENTCDIEELLRMYGYHGPYTSTDVIPADDLYNRAMYLIGTGMPYKVYQYNDLTKRFTYIGDYNTEVGPEGPPGPPGPQGPQGPQGEPGKAGIASITVNGNTYEPVDGNITIPDYPTSLEWDNIENKPDNLVTSTDLETTLSDYELKSDAFSGDYNDLTNKPTIPVVDYPVTSVNSKTGDIVLSAEDIKTKDQTTVQENVDRIYNSLINVSDALNEEVTAIANDLSNHTSDTTIHVTASDKETWSNKLDKVTTATSVAQVYYKAANGTNMMRDCRTDAVANQSIMMRDNTGHCKVIDPVDDSDIANKKYVDNNVSNMVTTDTVQTITGQKTFQTTVTTPNLTAQGTNQSTVYGSNQVVHTFSDNTKLNLQYPKKSGNKTIATVDDLSNMVTTDTEQTISGKKTFNDFTKFNSSIRVYGPGTPGMVEGSAVELSSTSLKRWDLYEGNAMHHFDLIVPRKNGTLALTSDIPDMSNYVTKSEIPEPDNIVTTNTDQTINANKTIKGTFRIARADSSTAFGIYNDQVDNISFAGFKYVGNKSIGTRYSLPIYNTETSKTIATTDQIPDTSNMATTNTEQTISAKKTFTNELRSESYIHIQDNSDGRYLQLYADKIAWKDNQGQLRDNSLPGGSGQLARLDDITYLAVTKNGDQTITGKKTFQTTVTAPNLTAQGNNESTIYGGTQMVHKFSDNTTLNLKYPKKSGNQTIATVGDIPNVSNMVTTDTEQTISGHKFFDEGSVDVSTRGNTAKAIRLYGSGGIGIYDSGTNGTRKAYLTLPRTSGTLALTSDIYYQNGDKFTNTGFYNANGYLTGGGKEIGFTITLPKNLKNIKTITVNKLSCNVRGIGGYLNGTGYIDYTKQTGITVNAYKAADNAVFIQIKMSNTTWGGTNNTPVAVAFAQASTLDITFNT